MIVYRMEDENGSGPYWCGFERSDSELLQLADSHNDASHPSPVDDFTDKIVVMQMQYRIAFGCPSELAIKRWFRGYLRMLQRILHCPI